MRLKHYVARLWEEQADNRNACPKRKEVLLMMYYIDKNWYHFIKEYIFSKFAFQEVAHPVGQPNKNITEILLACRHTLVAKNRRESVRLHHWYICIIKCVYINVCIYYVFISLKKCQHINIAKAHKTTSSYMFFESYLATDIYIYINNKYTCKYICLLFLEKKSNI